MKFLLTLSLFIFSTAPCLADVSLESDIKPIRVEPKAEVQEEIPFLPSMPVVERKETQKNEDVAQREPASETVKEQPKEEISDSRLNVQLSNSLLTGKVYFGGHPTPAEFNSYDLDIQLVKTNWLYGVQLDYLFNPGSITIFNLGLNAGYKHDWNRLQFLIYGGLGLTNYQEKSALQNISAYGPSVSATAAINFFITHNLYLNVNYKYLHPMYTNDLSYWVQTPVVM